MRAIVGVLLLLSLVAISSQSCHNPGWTSIGGSGGGGGNGGGGGAAQTVEAQTVEAQTVEAQRGEAQTVEADFVVQADAVVQADDIGSSDETSAGDGTDDLGSPGKTSGADAKPPRRALKAMRKAEQVLAELNGREGLDPKYWMACSNLPRPHTPHTR